LQQYIDISDMSRTLHKKYPEYGRRKLKVFYEICETCFNSLMKSTAAAAAASAAAAAAQAAQAAPAAPVIRLRVSQVSTPAVRVHQPATIEVSESRSTPKIAPQSLSIASR
jgi:hypothetical protein